EPTDYGVSEVGTTIIGFDENARDLGRGEAGAKSAQPIWNDFMKSRWKVCRSVRPAAAGNYLRSDQPQHR
ncbi:hypothetical protein UA45_08095, partial [Morganella morganii]